MACSLFVLIPIIIGVLKQKKIKCHMPKFLLYLNTNEEIGSEGVEGKT
jgi:hypothetical protein